MNSRKAEKSDSSRATQTTRFLFPNRICTRVAWFLFDGKFPLCTNCGKMLAGFFLPYRHPRLEQLNRSERPFLLVQNRLIDCLDNSGNENQINHKKQITIKSAEIFTFPRQCPEFTLQSVLFNVRMYSNLKVWTSNSAQNRDGCSRLMKTDTESEFQTPKTQPVSSIKSSNNQMVISHLEFRSEHKELELELELEKSSIKRSLPFRASFIRGLFLKIQPVWMTGGLLLIRHWKITSLDSAIWAWLTHSGCPFSLVWTSSCTFGLSVFRLISFGCWFESLKNEDR